MNIILRNMTKEEYPEWIEVSTKQQALDRASVSDKSYDEEYNGLLEMLKVLLPEQYNTKGHHFYSIDTKEDNNVGYIWCGILPGLPQDAIFLMDIHLLNDFRSKGIGRTALDAMHTEMKTKGYKAIYLNVLNNNFAKKLYLSVGYSIAEEDTASSTLFFNLQ